MKQSQLIKCFLLLQSFTAGACIFHHCRHLLWSLETQRQSGTKTLFLDYFSLSICQCHTLSLFSPAVTSKMHIKKCKSTMKSTYCKTHALARDLRIYIELEPTFAFSLWTISAFKSMGPFNVLAFKCQCSQMPASSCMFLNIWSQEWGHTNICYLLASQILMFMADLHFPAWFLSECKIFRQGMCTYGIVILDIHSLLQLHCSQTEEKANIFASHEFSLLRNAPDPHV